MRLSNTTLIAIGMLILALVACVGFAFGKFDASELTLALASIGTLGTVLIGFHSQDQNKKRGGTL